MPLSAKAYRFYDKEILPEIDHIRGTVRLHGVLKKIGLSSIVSKTDNGFRLDAVDREPILSEKIDAKYIFMETEYLKELLESTEDTRIFCDVGGYHGFYSLVSNSKKSVVFEADPENADHLKNNIALNPDRYIEIVEKAVWNSNGTVEFQAEGSGTSHVSENGIEREAVSLDSFFRDRDAPDVIKIDVEGAGFQVLKGATEILEEYKPDIFIELHDDGRIEGFGGSREQIEELLKNHGYEKKFERNRGSETHQVWKQKIPSAFREGGKFS